MTGTNLSLVWPVDDACLERSVVLAAGSSAVQSTQARELDKEVEGGMRRGGN